MELKDFQNRDIAPGYIFFDGEKKPQNGWESFKRVVKRSVKGELFVGLWIVFREMIRFDIHTVQYPIEKIEMSPRYRAIHRLLRLLESENERCIGCGLCEKICIANCIRMETRLDENKRKEVTKYSINFGRCIFCGYCAEVCPELAIVHGNDYENASEQRAHFGLKEDMLTPIDTFRAKQQKEFSGFGALSDNADENIKKTPLAY
ncbi:MAG: NADH-quinone oxidoreductase subunit NuoI [Sulfurospirillaceae bacterium]|nr:NADH-quinone oxidoreductase subunit NuoI [Sulfurospirillaceae bacterium]MDD3462222.1 NADH-quinone oxidoreductase subunit NuoI [Sulfurospirillaceae bacterium]